MRSWVGVLLLLAPVAGCAPRESARAGSEVLAGSLEVQVAGDTVWLSLHVTNTTGAPLALQFATAQRFEFEVLTAGGEEAWRWSADQLFAQVLGEEELAAGATLRERVWWLGTGRRGMHVAVGRLVALNQPVELRTEFELGVE